MKWTNTETVTNVIKQCKRWQCCCRIFRATPTFRIETKREVKRYTRSLIGNSDGQALASCLLSYTEIRKTASTQTHRKHIAQKLHKTISADAIGSTQNTEKARNNFCDDTLKGGNARLAQPVQHQTLNPRATGSRTSEIPKMFNPVITYK